MLKCIIIIVEIECLMISRTIEIFLPLFLRFIVEATMKVTLHLHEISFNVNIIQSFVKVIFAVA
jgi:hypothetical protein